MPQRSLTEEEISSILFKLEPNKLLPEDTASSIVKTQRKKIEWQLRQIKIYPEKIPELKRRIEIHHVTSLVAPGEAVGIVCAQSIGHILTQKTLDSFHSAGRTELATTVGVPRCKQLLLATRTPRSKASRIFFLQNDSSLDLLRTSIGASLVGLSLKNLCTDMTVTVDYKEDKWLKTFQILYGDKYGDTEEYSIDGKRCCIECHLNKEKIFEYKIKSQDVAEKLISKFDNISVAFSPPETSKLVIFVDASDIELPPERAYFEDKIEAPLIYLEEVIIPILEKEVIFGIEGIHNIYFNNKEDKWFAEAEGSNYKKLLAHPMVDASKTVTSNVWYIYEVLGIEAVREFLFEEFSNVMEGINICHPKLLVDRMTHEGTISSISRYTLRDEQLGALGKASFEESMKNFEDEAFRGGVEKINGVSASTICGKMAPVGTGINKVMIDVSKLLERPILADTVTECSHTPKPPSVKQPVTKKFSTRKVN